MMFHSHRLNFSEPSFKWFNRVSFCNTTEALLWGRGCIFVNKAMIAFAIKDLDTKTMEHAQLLSCKSIFCD